jgi:hypothetical protein
LSEEALRGDFNVSVTLERDPDRRLGATGNRFAEGIRRESGAKLRKINQIGGFWPPVGCLASGSALF